VQIKTYADLVSPDERNTLVGFVEARTQDGFDIEIAARVTEPLQPPRVSVPGLRSRVAPDVGAD
jgi:hypothetical protein